MRPNRGGEFCLLSGEPPAGGTGVSRPRAGDGGIRALGAGRGIPPCGGTGGIRPRGRDDARALPVLGIHPPFSFLCLAREKRMRRARWKRKESALVLAPVHSIPRSDWRKLDAWTHGLLSLPALRAWPVPFGQDSAPIPSEGPGLCAGPGGRRGWL